MTGYTRKLGKAIRAEILREDHGILTAYVELDYGNGVQSTPLPSLSYRDAETKKQVYAEHGLAYIDALMAAFGVGSWAKIPGRTVWVLHEVGDDYGYIAGLEPLETEEGERLIIADVFEEVAV